jgi:hypothetical protein
MRLLTRRKVLLGALGVGGVYFYTSSGGQQPEGTTTERLRYTSDPITISGDGRAETEPVKIEADGVVVGRVESENEGFVRLYDDSNPRDRITLQETTEQSVESVESVYESEFAVITQAGIGGWSVTLRPFDEPVEQPTITAPIETSGVGRRVVGCVQFNADIPTKIQFEPENPTDSTIHLFDSGGGYVVDVFGELTAEDGVFQNDIWVGGDGFLQIDAGGEWDLSVSHPETYNSR